MSSRMMVMGVVAAILLGVSFAPAASPTGDGTTDARAAGTWTVGAEAVWLTRSDMRKYDLVDLMGTTVLDTQDVDFSLEPGIRFTTIYRITDDWAVEATYLGLHHWDPESSVTDGLERLHPSDPLGSLVPTDGAFNDAEKYVGVCKSDLNSIEINARRTFTDELTMLCGLRYVRFDDNVTLTAYDTLPITDPMWIGAVKTRTTNDLIGLQLGADYEHWFSECLSASVAGKGGIFANFYDFRGSLSDPGGEDGVPPLSVKNSSNGCAPAGVFELGAFGNWRFARNWTLRAGYNALWLSGVAVATEQRAESARHHGDVLFHGPSIGVVAHW